MLKAMGKMLLAALCALVVYGVLIGAKMGGGFEALAVAWTLAATGMHGLPTVVLLVVSDLASKLIERRSARPAAFNAIFIALAAIIVTTLTYPAQNGMWHTMKEMSRFVLVPTIAAWFTYFLVRRIDRDSLEPSA